MSFSTIPADILFETVAYFDDLRDLRAVVTTNRSLYQTFDVNRANLLRHVFRNQILRYRAYRLKQQSFNINPKYDKVPISVLNFVSNTLKRKVTKLDELTLRSTAWSVFLGLKSPFWVFGTFGRKLVALCEELLHTELALSYGVELWGYLRTRQTSEHLTRTNVLGADWDANQLALKLSGLYFRDVKRRPDAVRVLLECYDMDIKQHDIKLFQKLMCYSENALEQDEVLSFFRRRAVRELQGLQQSKSNNCDLHSTFCLTMILCRLEKLQDAICLFNNAFDTVWEHSLDPVSLTGLARRLITSLMKNQQHEEAFTIRRQMLSLFSRTRRSTTSQYLGWAKQYIWELYSLDRTDDALIVEEQCWNHVRQQLALVKQRSYVYTGQNAAWSLSRSYEKRGEYAQAKRVRLEYETLAQACMKPGSVVPWPGEDSFTRTKETSDYVTWTEVPDQISHNLEVEV